MHDASADEPVEGNTEPADQAFEIRNLLRARPPSLVLLAGHRMIGIFGKIGYRDTIDTPEAFHWSTDKVNQLIEDIVKKRMKHDLGAAHVQRLSPRKPNFSTRVGKP